MKKYSNKFDMNRFASEMQHVRNHRMWSQEHASEIFQISYNYYVKIENKKALPSIGLICAIADEYDISIDDFIVSKKSSPRATKTSDRKQIDNILEKSDENFLKIIRSIVEALNKTI